MRLPMRLPVLIIVLLLGAMSSAAQQSNSPTQSGAGSSQSLTQARCIPAWNSFGGSNDLPSTIHSSIRTSDGFIYIGGRDGLYRVEGGNVRAWTPNFSDPDALPAGRVEALAEFDGALWAGTAAGLAQLPIGQNEFRRVPINSEGERRASVSVLEVYEGKLFVGTSEGLFTLEGGPASAPLPFATDELKEFGTITAMAPVGRDLYIGGGDGVLRYNQSDGLRSMETSFDVASVVAIESDTNGRLWVATTDDLFVFDPSQTQDWSSLNAAERADLPEGTFTSLTVDETGYLWVGTRDGLYRTIDGGGAFEACRQSIEGSDRNQSVSVSHLNGSLGSFLFVGSHGRGASVAPLNTGVQLVVPGEGLGSGLPDNPIWSTARSGDGRLLIGTTDGLYQEESSGSGMFDAVAASSLGDKRIYTIANVNDEAWLGTDGGLFRVRPDGVAISVPLIRSQAEIVSPHVYTIKQAPGLLLFGTSSGLVTMDSQTLRTKSFYRTNTEHEPFETALVQDFEGNRVWSIDAVDGLVLATGDTGSWAIDIKSDTIVGRTDQAVANGSFTPGRIYSVLDAGDGQVLLGTESGIVKTDRSFSGFENIVSINGVPLRSVMAMGRAKDGSLWIGVAGSGLFHKMPGDDNWQHFSQSDGLITNGVSQLGLSFPEDGSVIVSNATGASIIAPDALEKPKNESLRLVATETLRGKQISTEETFSVGPKRRDMRIHFAVPELLEAGKYRVAYTLALNDDVIQNSEVALGEDLIFPRLEPGNYELTGKLVSGSGAQSEPLVLALQVSPFWWERQSTYLALLLVVAAVAIGVFYYRARSIERKFQIIADERRRIAQELHDSSLQDLFGAQMLGRSLKVDGSLPSAEGQKEQVLGLLKSATASMRESVMTLRESPETPTLSEAIGSFEPPAALSSNVHIDYLEEGSKWKVGKHRRFFVARIAQEAINNAAKHAHASKISTKLDWSFWKLTLEVADDGDGFDPIAEDTNAGHGRGAMQCMADAVSGTLETVSSKGKGTRIRLEVPRFAL